MWATFFIAATLTLWAAQDAEAEPASDAASRWRAEIAERALGAAREVDEPYRRSEIYVRIAQAQAKAQDVRAAYATIELALASARHIAQPSFRDWAYAEIVNAQLAVDDEFGATATAALIRSKAPHGAAFARIAERHVRSGAVDKAQALALNISDVGIRSGVLRDIAAVHAAADDIPAAAALLPHIKDRLQQSLAYGDLAAAEMRAGSLVRAERWAARSPKRARGQVWARIALTQAQRGDIAGALITVEKVREPVTRTAALAAIATERAGSSVPPTGDELLQRAAREAHLVAEPRRRAELLAYLARRAAQSGERHAALLWLKEAQADALRLPTDEGRDATLDLIARSFLRVGEIGRALAVAHQINDRIMRALVVRDAAARQLEPDDAGQIAAPFNDPLIIAAALFGVLGEHERQAQPTPAAVVDAAVFAVEQLEDAQFKPAAFAALATVHLRRGELEAAQGLFARAAAFAAAIKDAEQRSAAYVRMLEALNDRWVFLGEPSTQPATEELDVSAG